MTDAIYMDKEEKTADLENGCKFNPTYVNFKMILKGFTSEGFFSFLRQVPNQRLKILNIFQMTGSLYINVRGKIWSLAKTALYMDDNSYE